jgi:hypothetical protein
VLVRNLSPEQKKDFENESQFRIDTH